MALGRFIRRWKKDRRGSVIVETAIGLPLLLATIIGVLEVANYFFVTTSLENAVLHASRFGITGGADSGTTREAQLLAVIEEQTFGWVDMNEVEVQTLVYEQFGDIGKEEPYTDANGNEMYDAGEAFSDVNGNGQWDSDMAVAGLGNAGDIVLYRVSYNAPSLTGFGDWATKAINIQATVAVRNEPY